ARKLVSPISDLVEGTISVAAGDYEKQLTVEGSDELGILLHSFNTMTRKISKSREVAEQSKLKEAKQKKYLESVMEHINSGVLTIDETGFIKSGNPAACSIFGIANYFFTELYIADVVREYPMMQHFFEVVQGHMENDREWQEEVVIFGHSGRQIMRVRGTSLETQSDDHKEQVIVVDDLTELIQAQKDSAWSEMARRLAHEIKNPLTPIQLSAERLQRKLSGKVAPDKQRMLDRYTQTIVQQVEAMKSMVNAFSDYARSPTQKPESLNLNQMLEAITTLYDADNDDVAIELDLDSSIPMIQGDPVRLRQLVHNLIKNSLETIDQTGWIKMQTRCVRETGRQFAELSVEDSGSGVADEIADSLFEPYVTTKTSGSGLGLAIVKKIVDEHGGMVWTEKGSQGGARFIVRLPLISQINDETSADETNEKDVRVIS
ncbi:MAG: HAMP domain-containing protein, partial [Proteobacteria bacterium]|nr:HAMP domain-containing protein [Pseudomonadota bacterium]